MKDACQGLFGEWFGHNFQTQAVLGPIDFSLLESVRVGPSSVDALRPVHAVVTLCTRCGMAPPVAPKGEAATPSSQGGQHG